MRDVQRNKRIQIIGWDSRGPEVEENVASVVIRDPRIGRRGVGTFCIGFKLIQQRSEMSNPDAWVYDHTNYWIGDNDTPVEREQLEAVLRTHNSSTARVLQHFCRRLRNVQ